MDIKIYNYFIQIQIRSLLRLKQMIYMKTLKIINNNMTFQNTQKIINYMTLQIKK